MSGTSAAVKSKPGFFYGWLVLAGAFIISGIALSMRYSFSVFLPALLDEFGWARADAALAASIGVLVYGLASPMTGFFVDRFGPKKVLFAGSILISGGLLLCSTINSLMMFYIAFGFITAFGINCTAFPVHNVYIPHWFVRKRGLAFGIVMAGGGMASMIAGFYQGFLGSLGWRGAYVALAVIASAVILPITFFIIKKTPQEMGQLPDGMAEAPGPEAAAARKKLMEAVIVDKKWAAVDWTLGKALKTPRLWFMMLWFCTYGFSFNLILMHMPTFARGLGFSAALAAAVFSLQGFSNLAGKFALGFVSDRLGREMTFSLFGVAMIGGITCLWATRAGGSPVLLYVWAILYGLTMGAAGPVGFAGLADMFFGKGYGTINGFCLAGVGIGGFAGPWVGGKIYDVTGSYDMAWVAAMVAVAVAAVMLWISGPGKVRLVPGKLPKAKS